MKKKNTFIDRSRKDYQRGLTLYNQGRYKEAEDRFQQALRGQLQALGQDDKRTIYSKHWLGCTLYGQKEYSRAEKLLQQAACGQERTLGKHHEDTLRSIHWLGCTLYYQKNYTKAEKLFQKVICGQRQILGEDHAETLYSKHWLGCTLYDQKRYKEAEELLEQAVYGQERILGPKHTETIHSKHWLGRTLYDQERYSEAGELFRQTVCEQEQIPGQDFGDIFNRKYWLGRVLYQQNKYNEAEELLQQAVYGQERILGPKHTETIHSKHWLGRTLYDQERYSEAEELFRQTVCEQEQIPGQDFGDILNRKYWLGRVLYQQNKYSEAEELLQQAVSGQGQILRQDHVETLATVNLLRQLRSNRLDNFFLDRQGHRQPYTGSEICEISTLLKNSNSLWSQVPRTYIVLRTIGSLNLLDDFIGVGFSDYLFPVTKRHLPDFLWPKARAAFIGAQRLVITQSLDLEKGRNAPHCQFEQENLVPLTCQGVLGQGGFGTVDKVTSWISSKEYARKRVYRRSGQKPEAIKHFINEIEIIKRLKHHHVVEFVGSYTDPKHIGLIMSPIAEMNLAIYLGRATVSHYGELRTFFGCLARALEFLHDQNIRHKDIKPHNILIHHGSVLLADFGLSFDFTDANSTTINTVNGMTAPYCAPEVALQLPRNAMSDIWSLGVVFMEMIVILKGKTIQSMDEFFSEHGSKQPLIRSNPVALSEFIEELKGIGQTSDNRAIEWTQQMLLADQQNRPTASSLLTSIVSKQDEGIGFCGICCWYPEEDFSDWMDEEDLA